MDRIFEIFSVFLLCVPWEHAIVDAGGCGTVDLTNDTAIIDSLNLMVNCSVDCITVKINPCVLEQMGYDPSTDITVNGPMADFYNGTECPGHVPNYVPAISWTFKLMEPYYDCYTEKSQSGDQYTYGNAIRSINFSSTNVIARRKNINLYFNCSYDRMFEASGNELYVDPNVPVVDASAEGSGALEANVTLCETWDCSDGTVISSGATVDVLAEIYIVFRTHLNFFVQIMEVIATSTSDPDGSPSYDLVTDGCLGRGEMAYSTLVNDQPFLSFLCIHLFQWTADHELDVYFHVKFKLCDLGIMACMSCNPSKRRRRSAVPSSDEVFTAVLGPFRTNAA